MLDETNKALASRSIQFILLSLLAIITVMGGNIIWLRNKWAAVDGNLHRQWIHSGRWDISFKWSYRLFFN